MSNFNSRNLVKQFSEMEEVCTLTNGEIEHLENAGLIASYEVTQGMIDEGAFEQHHLGGTTGNLTSSGRCLMEQRSVEELEALLDGTTKGRWLVGAPRNKVILCDESGEVKTTSNGWGKVIVNLAGPVWMDGEEFNNTELIAAAPDVTRQCILVTKERDDLLALIQDIYDNLTQGQTTHGSRAFNNDEVEKICFFKQNGSRIE